MIIKSHVWGGYRAGANYPKAVGSNEKIRLVDISDAGAKDLDEAFRNMWLVGKTTRAQKPPHHVSINPHKDERLTDEQVRRIYTRLEAKYGYKPGDHQRVTASPPKRSVRPGELPLSATPPWIPDGRVMGCPALKDFLAAGRCLYR